jgi:chromosome segregation ATPase
MRTRYKILILLFTLTLALGALTLLRSGNDADAVLRFRSLFSTHTLYDLTPLLTSITDRTSLWYGGISLFAIIMIVLVFRAARVNGSQRSRARLIELKPAKARAGNVSYDEMLKDRPARHSNDAALQNLEMSARRIRALENDLREKEELLQSRDGELSALRSRGATLTDPTNETVLGKPENERVLREELERMREVLQAKETNTRELKNSLAEKQQLLQSQSQELDALRSRGNALTEQLADLRPAKEQAEKALQQELKKTKVLQAKDSIITGLENSLTVTQELLQSRSQELDALKSRLNSVTEQLTDLRQAKERAENVLQWELKKKALQAKGSTVAEDGLSGTVHTLERELSAKQELLQTRSGELKAAKSKVNTLRERLSALGSTKKQTESALQQQLKQKTELLQSKEAAMKELQESLNARVHALEEQLKDRDAKLEALGSEANNATESGSAREQAKSLLLQELQNRTELLQTKDAIVKELEERLNATVHALENVQRELEKLEKQRDAALLDPRTKIAPAKEQAEAWLRPERSKGMNSKLLELGAVKARAAASLPAEEAKPTSEASDSSMKEPREISSRAQDQEGEKET